MKKIKCVNSRSKPIKSALVLKNYLSLLEHALTLDNKVISETLHNSIIFFYISQLINHEKFPNHDLDLLNRTCLKLSKIFKVATIQLDNKFMDEAFATSNLYSPLQIGYVVDICQQFHLANKTIDESTKTEFIQSSGYRKMRGAFFTPYEIAKLISHHSIDEVLKNGVTEPKILDMGCGTGVFACATAHDLIERGFTAPIIIKKLVYGVDVEDFSASITKAILQAELQIPIEEFSNLDTVRTHDILFGNLDYGLFTSNAELLNTYDVVVMNPPYDRLKADSADKSEKLLVERKIKFVKESPIYQNSSSGSIDLYRLFIEKGLSILSPKGVMGAIVPTTFLADKSASQLRKYFLDRKSISELILYPEKAKIFENVTQACSIFIANLSKNTPSIKISTMNSLESVESEIKVPLSIIESTSPNYLPIPIVNKKGLSILEKLNQFPRIRDIDGIVNRRGELDLSLDKSYLLGSDERLLKGISVSLFHFDQIFKVDFDSFIKARASSSRINDVLLPRIAGQQISNLGSGQRLKFCFVPENFLLGNSLNYLTVNASSFNNSFNLYTLLGLLNSSLLNWRFKLTSSNNHVNNYEIDDLPIPINAPAFKIKKINELVEQITNHKPEKIIDSNLLAQLNSAVFDCFELTPEDL